ncbi:hypothetical protein, partial [Jeotgalibaca porci]|uniref:hypothetical protein n=1 Tax=Jeotgalibaca porci TaxID=1868793 RepID=UPI0035A19DE7
MSAHFLLQLAHSNAEMNLSAHFLLQPAHSNGKMDLSAQFLAMYHTAREDKKKFTASLMIAAAFASFFTGVT